MWRDSTPARTPFDKRSGHGQVPEQVGVYLVPLAVAGLVSISRIRRWTLAVDGLGAQLP